MCQFMYMVGIRGFIVAAPLCQGPTFEEVDVGNLSSRTETTQVASSKHVAELRISAVGGVNNVHSGLDLGSFLRALRAALNIQAAVLLQIVCP